MGDERYGEDGYRVPERFGSIGKDMFGIWSKPEEDCIYVFRGMAFYGRKSSKLHDL